MRGRVVWSIFAKELRDTLRDRRTLIVMIVVPIVLYPGIGLLLGQVAAHQRAKLEQRPVTIALRGEAVPELRELLVAVPGVKLADPAPSDPAGPLIVERKLDAALSIPAGTTEALAAGKRATITLEVDETRDESREAARRVRQAFDGYRQTLVARALAARGVPKDVLEPMRLARRNVASRERMGASIVARTVPILLVVMIVLGAFFPAIDLSAGEKERGTLETLLTSPIRPMEVVAGKFLAVCLVAMISGTANLVSMGATFAQGLALLGVGADIGFEISASRFALVFAMMVPLALLVSGLLLAVAVLAQSFKEAQNLLTPTYLALVFPSMLASMPGIELDALTSFVPGLNATLLTRDVFLGEATLEKIFSVLLANAAYTAVALVFAARNFTSEAVLFGGPKRGWRFERGEGGRPTASQSFLYFAILFVLLWYAAQALQRWNLVAGLVLTEWGLLFGLALAFALFMRFELRSTFRLRLPSPRGALAALLAGAGMSLAIPFIVMPLQNAILPAPTQLTESMKHFFEVGRSELGEVGVLFIAALTPAVCEEFVFRGLVMDGIRSRLSTAATVLVSGLLFGAFHMSIYRFLPTAVAGALIAWVVLETGSLFAGMLMHALYNGGLLVAALKLGDVEVEAPLWVVALGALALAAGVVLARGSARPERVSSPVARRAS